MTWLWRSRRKQVEESREAIKKSDRLGPAIELQRQEALGVSKWARERLDRNHLTQIFEAGRRA